MSFTDQVLADREKRLPSTGRKGHYNAEDGDSRPILLRNVGICLQVHLALQSRRQNIDRLVRFQVLTAASVKITVIWDFVSCSLVEVDRRFRGAYCLHHHGAASQKTVIFINSLVFSSCRAFANFDVSVTKL
jgi:hypothetical protein